MHLLRITSYNVCYTKLLRWSSNLALTGNESYFYPAAGLTGILSQMVTMPDFITFAKVRASASQVNNEIPWGKIMVNHTITTSGVNRNTVKPFTDAKPEQLVNYELGTDWRFFNGRLGLDFTYYYISSTNQALSRPLSGSQQDNYYTSEWFNAGKIVNKGVEIVLNAKPVITSYSIHYTKLYEFDNGEKYKKSRRYLDR